MNCRKPFTLSLKPFKIKNGGPKPLNRWTVSRSSGYLSSHLSHKTIPINSRIDNKVTMVILVCSINKWIKHFSVFRAVFPPYNSRIYKVVSIFLWYYMVGFFFQQLRNHDKVHILYITQKYTLGIIVNIIKQN